MAIVTWYKLLIFNQEPVKNNFVPDFTINDSELSGSGVSNVHAMRNTLLNNYWLLRVELIDGSFVILQPFLNDRNGFTDGRYSAFIDDFDLWLGVQDED